MIDKASIENLVNQFVKDNDLFLVAVKVSSSNKITVLADSMKGITIDECALLHRHIENGLDREVEDFELQVSSPGLEMPFCVIQQYYRNEGRKVAVIDEEGSKYTGILRNVTSGGFDLEMEIKQKGKIKEKKILPFNFDQVKSVKEVLEIR